MTTLSMSIQWQSKDLIVSLFVMDQIQQFWQQMKGMITGFELVQKLGSKIELMQIYNGFKLIYTTTNINIIITFFFETFYEYTWYNNYTNRTNCQGKQGKQPKETER